MVKLTWEANGLLLDERTFINAVSAQKFVRKQLDNMPQLHAKWTPRRADLYCGPNLHSSFIVQDHR